MPDPTTSAKGLTQPTVGGDNNNWGGFLNADLSLIDTALGGTFALSISGNTTLTSTQVQNTGYEFTGTLTGIATITWPSFYGFAVIQNNTTGGFSISCGISGGGNVTVLNGETVPIWSNGTNFARLAQVGGGATVSNADLQNSSITIAGHSVSLGGTQTLAASDLTNGTTGSGDVVLTASPAIASPTVSGTLLQPTTGSKFWLQNLQSNTGGFSCVIDNGGMSLYNDASVTSDGFGIQTVSYYSGSFSAPSAGFFRLIYEPSSALLTNAVGLYGILQLTAPISFTGECSAVKGNAYTAANITATIQTGGANNVVGDVLTLVGGTLTGLGTTPTFTVATVSSGAVTSVTFGSGLECCTVYPSNPVTVTSSNGGATPPTLNLTVSSSAVTSLAGTYGRVNHGSSGTIALAAGLYSDGCYVDGNGTITTAAGVYILAPHTGTVGITSSYGVLFDGTVSSFAQGCIAVTSGNLTLNVQADSQIAWGVFSSHYNYLSFNGIISSSGLGFFGGETGDNTLYFNAPTGGGVNWRINGADLLKFRSSSLSPEVTNSFALGSSSLIWSNVFTNTLTMPGGTTPLATTATAITSGAGSGAGTLTNAPSAGNPTKWIPINDNGTTRYIPAW